MLKIFKNKLHLILIVLIFSSCATTKIAKKDDGSIIAVSATSTGLGAKGYGLWITLENTDTKQMFKSKSLSPLSPHSVIQNLPAGKYIVKEVEVSVGSLFYSNWSDNVTTFFGQIEIKPNSKYYLGDFTGTRKVGRKNVLRLSIENQNIPEEVRAMIENEKTGWISDDFIKLYPYEKETLLVY